MIRKDKEKARAAGDPAKRRTERTPHKCFICGSIYHQIAKFPKSQKYKNKQHKQVRLNERGNDLVQPKMSPTVRMISIAHFSVHILLLHHYQSDLAHLSDLYSIVIGLYKSER